MMRHAVHKNMSELVRDDNEKIKHLIEVFVLYCMNDEIGGECRS